MIVFLSQVLSMYFLIVPHYVISQIVIISTLDSKPHLSDIKSLPIFSVGFVIMLVILI